LLDRWIKSILLSAYIYTNDFQKDVEPANLTISNDMDNSNGSNNETISSTGDVWYKGSKLPVISRLDCFHVLQEKHANA